MMLERLKEKHLREMEDLQAQLESKVSEFDQKVEAQKAALSLQYMEEIQALRGEMSSSQNRALELQAQLEQAAADMEGLEGLQAKAEPGLDKEMQELRKQHAVELYKLGEEHKEEILLTRTEEEERGKLQEERAEVERRLSEEWEREKVELQQRHEEAVKARIEEVSVRFQVEREELEMRLAEEWEREKVELQQRHEEAVKARIEEVEMRLTEEWQREKVELQQRHEEAVKARIEEVEMRLTEEWQREKVELQQRHEEAVKARIEEVSSRFQVEREELEMRLAEEWEREKVLLDEQTKASLQTVLEEQENREARLTEQWELERARLQQCREVALLTGLAEERRKQQEETERRLREDWHRERLQLEEDYEGMLQERLQEEREEVEKRLGKMMEEEKERLKEVHRHAVQDLSAKHSEEREQLSCLLDKLREDIAEKSLKLEHFRKEKISAQRKAESFKRQISALRLRRQQLEDENGLLSEKNAQNAAGVEGLSQQPGELLRQSERQEAVRDQQRTVPEDDRTKMAVCVSALEAELTNAVEGTVLLEEGKAQLVLQLNALRDKMDKVGAVECQLSVLLQEHKALDKQTQGLRNQLATSQERTHVLEESLQSVNLQRARLKADLRVSQQEKDALKQEVMSLHKQLQNGNDKNRVLEMALHSSGYQSQHKKLYRDELARLVEQELRQENERLTMELHNTKGDLHHTRDKTRQLEAAILTLTQRKQQGQSSVVKTVEQEKTALKRELDVTHQELLSAHNKVCEVQRELESLRRENEGLKPRPVPVQARLLEAQLGGLLPSSPRRMPGEWRGQHCEDDHNPENIQGAAMPKQRAAHADSYRRIGGL
ncbi:unnamed protein product [Coregonus sp. 'balchen']|nr:unnamed protein product [Coregonus sp. 'balchen']